MVLLISCGLIGSVNLKISIFLLSNFHFLKKQERIKRETTTKDKRYNKKGKDKKEKLRNYYYWTNLANFSSDPLNKFNPM